MPLPASYLALRRGLLLRLALSAGLMIALVITGWSLAPRGDEAASQAPSALPASSAIDAAQVPPTAVAIPAAQPLSTSAGPPPVDIARGSPELESLHGKALEVLMQRPVDAAEAPSKSATDEPSKPTAAPPKLPKGPHLQAGIFASPANAEEMRKKLEAEGYPAYLETRVHVGPFPNRKEADRAREKLKEQGTTTLFIAQ